MKTINLDSKTIEALAGTLDESLRLVEARFDVRVSARGGALTIMAQGDGAGAREERVADLFTQLAALHAQGVSFGRDNMKTAVGIMAREEAGELAGHFLESRLKPSARKAVVLAGRPLGRGVDDGVRAAAGFSGVEGIAYDGAGTIYVAAS